MISKLHPIETNINNLIERLKKNTNIKILGLDIGKTKIGIASGHFATNTTMPYKVIKSQPLAKNAENILAICTTLNISDIVVGIPLQNNTLNNIEYIIKLAATLAANFKTYFQDESFSSCIADELLRETSLNRKKREQLNDAIAATIILNNFFSKLKPKILNLSI